jgi:hypothetical protein
MTLVDANLLLYAYDRDSSQHTAARDWLEAELSSGRPVRFALVTLLAFVRIASDRRVFVRPLAADEACGIVSSWLALPAVRVVTPGSRSWSILGGLCGDGQVSGAHVMDAHLAALAVEHGLIVATTDRDFLRFPGVEVVNPLASE